MRPGSALVASAAIFVEVPYTWHGTARRGGGLTLKQLEEPPW